jgi:hypothetical protein
MLRESGIQYSRDASAQHAAVSGKLDRPVKPGMTPFVTQYAFSLLVIRAIGVFNRMARSNSTDQFSM